MAHRAPDDAHYPWLSEFLCEYVDGTMEPGARAMFEECVRGNPELLKHVERLCATREMLCAYGCRDLPAPCDLHALLHRRIALERGDAHAPRTLPPHLGMVTLVFAAVLVVMTSSLALPPSELPAPREPRAMRSAVETSAFVPAFHRDRPTIMPDTLPHSGSMLRIRATLSGTRLVP